MMTEKTAYENLLRAAETLLERREDQMVTEVEWDALKTAVDALRPSDEDELIEEDAACPKCSERRVDQLEWNAEGEFAVCGSCGFEYRP